MRRISISYFFHCSFFLLVQVSLGQNKGRINTIIVDAGHGGTDQGAKGSYSTEAQITLQLAMKVTSILEKSLPETKILQDRTTDVFHDVRAKAEFANQNKGDLFVCIHVNAAPPIRHSIITGHHTITYYSGKGKNRKSIRKRERYIKSGIHLIPSRYGYLCMGCRQGF